MMQQQISGVLDLDHVPETAGGDTPFGALDRPRATVTDPGMDPWLINSPRNGRCRATASRGVDGASTPPGQVPRGATPRGALLARWLARLCGLKRSLPSSEQGRGTSSGRGESGRRGTQAAEVPAAAARRRGQASTRRPVRWASGFSCRRNPGLESGQRRADVLIVRVVTFASGRPADVSAVVATAVTPVSWARGHVAGWRRRHQLQAGCVRIARGGSRTSRSR